MQARRHSQCRVRVPIGTQLEQGDELCFVFSDVTCVIAQFSTFEIEAPPRGQLASELAAFHRAGLLAKNTSVKPSQETDVVAASRCSHLLLFDTSLTLWGVSAHMANAKESWEACNEVHHGVG